MFNKWLVVLALSLVLSGCGAVRDRVLGVSQPDRALPFRTSLARGEDRRDIAVRVRAGGVSVPQVRESVRFAATRYCLKNFGGSDTRWQIDPTSQDWAFARDGEDMVFQGRCVAR